MKRGIVGGRGREFSYSQTANGKGGRVELVLEERGEAYSQKRK